MIATVISRGVPIAQVRPLPPLLPARGDCFLPRACTLEFVLFVRRGIAIRVRLKKINGPQQI